MGGTVSDAASVASTASAPSSARGSSNDGDVHTMGLGKKSVEDEEALKVMHQNVAAVLADVAAAGGMAAQAEALSASLPLPNVWVSRWVDYSKKYGLGYKLSNGQYGVFFNDATKILLKHDGDKLDYIQRQRDEAGGKYDTRSEAKMSEHTKDLAKKVTLMQHFRNYLDDPNRHPSSAEPADAKSGGDEGVYVRKWMRTRHSVIFRLSNNCLQVSFLDDTEVLLWANRRWVTIKSKDSPRRTLDLKDAAAMPDAAKRLKYVHDILAQLVAV
jgi:polo-like kinase 1